MKYLIISLGGILGANTRFLLGTWVARKTGAGMTPGFPWGTFIINVSGSFILGLFMALSLRYHWQDNWRLLIAVGFLGAYTTFSSFEYESIALLMSGNAGLALRNLVGSVLVGLLSVWLGVVVGRAGA